MISVLFIDNYVTVNFVIYSPISVCNLLYDLNYFPQFSSDSSLIYSDSDDLKDLVLAQKKSFLALSSSADLHSQMFDLHNTPDESKSPFDL